MKKGSIRRAIAFRNAQSPPSGEAGETITADLRGSDVTAGPFPLSRTWNESVNESERVEARSSCGVVVESDGVMAGVGDGGAVTAGNTATSSVAVAATVGVGVGVSVTATSSSKSVV